MMLAQTSSHPLTPQWVFKADDGTLQHIGVREDDALNVQRRYFVPARFDDVRARSSKNLVAAQLQRQESQQK